MRKWNGKEEIWVDGKVKKIEVWGIDKNTLAYGWGNQGNTKSGHRYLASGKDHERKVLKMINMHPDYDITMR